MKHLLLRRRPLVNAALAAVMAVGLMSPLPAQAQQNPYPETGTDVSPSVINLLSAYEPQMGRGTQLAPGQPQEIPLGSGAASAHSALVRLSVFAAGTDLQVDLSSFPALSVAAGQSASTTVLVPVVDGKISAATDAAANVRVDVLALFSGDKTAPGSTVALPTPVLRADTYSSLAANATGQGLTATDTLVGLTGLGGVPVDGVRAAYVSATVSTPAATTLILDGQRLSLPAGRTTVTTVVTPSAQGDIAVSAGGAEVQLQLQVRGYVAEAPENSPALNGAGSYWPAANTADREIDIDDAAGRPISWEGSADAGYVLAMVDADPAKDLTMVNLGAPYRGRAQGAVVDPTAGAQPQLAVVPVKGAELSVRRGSTSVGIQELGSFLGPDAEAGGNEASLTLSSPTTNEIDATDDYALRFEGTAVTDGTAPLRIEVSLDGEPHGSAGVRPTADGVGWTFTSAVRDPGNHTFEFTLVSRGGTRSIVSWAGSVVLPAADDTVLTPDTVVIGSPGHVAEVLSVTDDAVFLGSDPNVSPGEVVVAGSSSGAPAGFLRRVIAIDVVGGEWRLTTTAATLDEIVLQADYEHTEPLGSSDLASAPETPGADPSDPDGFFRVLTGDEVDLEPYPGEVLTPEGTEYGAAGISGYSSFRAPDAASGANLMRSEFKEELSFRMGDSFPDQAPQPGDGLWETKLDVEAELGFALKVSLKAELKFTEGSWLPPAPPLPYPGIEEFSTSVESAAKAVATVKVEAEESFSKEWKGPKRNITFNPVTFAIGPLPVVIVSGLDIELKGEVEITGSATVAFSTGVERKHELGFRYSHGKTEKIDEGPKTTFTAPSLDKEGTGVKGGVEATVGPEIAFDAKVYGLAGPELGFTVKVGAGLTADGNLDKPKVEVETFLEGKLFIRGQLTIPVIKKDLVDVTLLEVSRKWSLSKTLFELVPSPGPGPGEGTPPEDEIDYGQDELGPATEEVAALDVEGADVLASYFVEGPPHPSAVSVFTQAIGGLPTSGEDYLVMSTGRAGFLFDPNQSAGGFEVVSPRGIGIRDVTTIRMDLEVPSDVNCLIGFDFRFYSNEYPQYVGSSFNDAFIVEMDKSTWTVDGSEISAPRNFAFDELGNPITINAAGPWTINAENAEGTSFSGATSLLRATTPVTPGKHSLYFSIFDMGDSIYDSAVLIDGVKFGRVDNPSQQCQSGVTAG